MVDAGLRRLDRISALMATATVALCLLWPRMDGDAAVYGLLAKHMVQHHDAVNLIFHGQDWLDKPHFPFWMVALSFAVLGVTTLAYQVPGLVFFGLGAWFTHRLALHGFGRQTAALARLVYLSLSGLLLAVADQKAEVYLLALMAGASYGWLRFFEATLARGKRWRWWALGAVCTGCAVMTKGVFVPLIVGAGLLAWLLVRHGWRTALSAPSLLAWGAACAGTALLTLPELLALHAQFDAHPERAVFGRTQVSGIRFFLWDSQFGRFFNTGPIQNAGGSPGFFLHNLVWTFFPALGLLIAALVSAVRTSVTAARAGTDRAALAPHALLWGTFVAAFALFSATRYQMDYYLVIAFPHAAIACAAWWARWDRVQTDPAPRWPLALHAGYVGLGLLLAVACTLFYAWSQRQATVLLALVPLAVGAGARHWPPGPRRIAWAATASMALFAFVVLFHHDLYVRYNVGRGMAAYTNALPDEPEPGTPSTERRTPVLVNGLIFNTFDFLSTRPTLQTHGPDELAAAVQRCCTASRAGGGAAPAPFYLVLTLREAPATLAALRQRLGPAPLAVRELRRFEEIELPKQFARQLAKRDAQLPRQTLVVLRVGG